MADSNFPPIPDPNPPAMSLPELDTSKIRIGNLLAQGKSARVYDVTIPDKDTNIYKPYVLKMFHDKEAFIRERAAYERMEEIPALTKGFVPRYYGTPQIPYSNIMQSIILSKHDGTKLKDAMPNLTLEVSAYLKILLTDILETLHGAGVYHGKVTPKNILVSEEQGHEVVLFNFCDAILKKDVEDSEVENYEAIDLCCVGDICDEVISDKVEKPQDCLAALVDMINRSDPELVRSIIDLYPVPAPILALPLAKRLHRNYKRSEAIELLKQSADAFTQLSPPSEQQSIEMVTVLQMKIAVARYIAGLRRDLEFTKSHYEEAIQFYLCSTPNASLANKTVMTLRYEVAKYYKHFKRYRDAMDLCIQAMTDAINTGREVSLDVWRDYGKLIEETKNKLSQLMNNIKEDKLKGTERSWRPWADLPTYEEAYRRAVDAKELYNEPWGSHRMTKLAVELHHGLKLDGNT